MDSNSRSKARWRSFSVRMLLVGTALIAVFLAIWRAKTHRHPAHAVPEYEGASYTSGYFMQVGPNRIAIQSIARNQYDGKIQVVRGSGLTTQIPQADVLEKCAKWLDVAQLEISPGPDWVDILEVRVFDHETRILLPQGDYGWQVVEPNLIQVYGLGHPIPDKLDVWLRVHSHADDHVYKLPPESGASIEVPEGKITISEMRANYAGWNSQHGFLPAMPYHRDSAIVLDCRAKPEARRHYQLATVSKEGRKQVDHQEIDWQRDGAWAPPRVSHVPADEISHYELRSYGSRHAFFFDGIELPSVNTRKFGPLPKPIVAIGGAEREGKLTEFEPLDIRYHVRKVENRENGIYEKYFYGQPSVDPDDEYRRSRISLLLTSSGIRIDSMRVRLKNNEDLAWGSFRAAGFGQGSVDVNHRQSVMNWYEAQLDTLSEIEFSLP